jgi:cytidylate kinase
MSAEPATPTLVTISAPYGAGGSLVGPRLAQRLGVPFLDRAIPAAVSARLDVPLDDALVHEELPVGAFSRLMAHFAPAVQMFAGATVPREALPQDDQAFRDATEQVLREYAAAGAVILGRAAAVVLRDRPHALHVRLDGPRERRIAQALRHRSADQATAEHELRAADLSREAYVGHWYHVDPRDPRLYHLVIDSTSIEIDACVDLIAVASRARVSTPPDPGAVTNRPPPTDTPEV